MTLRELLWTLSPVTLRTPPFWRRSWKHRAARLLLGACYCYLGVVLLLWSLENRLLYRGTPASLSWSQPPDGVTVEDVQFATADGTRLHAWWCIPPGWQSADGALLFFHGNGGNLSHRGWCIADLHKQLRTGVLLVDYPGYGRSAGVSTEKGCYAAGDAAYDWLTETRDVPGRRIILYGGSLGGGIATDLAARRPHRALVLVSTFTSFPDQAQALYPWLPARWLVRNQFNNLAKLAAVSGPVFVAHGRQDGLVPFAMGERLFAAAPEPKRMFAMDYWDHNDVPQPEAIAALGQFLKAHPGADPE
jgi:pimeloyl-ACP methyl ester carboxylesterase